MGTCANVTRRTAAKPARCRKVNDSRVFCLGFGPPGAFGLGGNAQEHHIDQLTAAYKTALQKYAEFSGRTSLGGYWRFVAVNIAISIVLYILAAASSIFLIVYILYVLALLIPGIAAGIRRLHDTGKSGWFVFFAFIPIVGFIILIVFLAQAGNPGPNDYGPPATD